METIKEYEREMLVVCSFAIFLIVCVLWCCVFSYFKLTKLIDQNTEIRLSLKETNSILKLMYETQELNKSLTQPIIKPIDPNDIPRRKPKTMDDEKAYYLERKDKFNRRPID